MTTRERWQIVAFVAAIVVVGVWAYWPAIGCDGEIVRGAFRMVCLP